MSDLRAKALGRWQGMLPSLGVGSRYLTGKHTACPICGEGRDRFRFDDRDGAGTWICSICGAGDGIKLVMLVNGWDFRAAAIEIEKHVGTTEFQRRKAERPEIDKRRDMNAVWQQGQPVQAGDPVALYLAARTGAIAFPGCLRTVDRLRYFADAPTWHPAMIAIVVDVEGKPVNLHRTYLTKWGTKAALEEPRRLMPGIVPKGSAIRLAQHSGALGIAEGIETAFSATALFGIPCWALINTAIMTQWIVPADVRELVIFADNDANYAGQAAAFSLAHRAKRSNLAVTIEIPAVTDTDWNDVHQLQRQAA